MKKKAIIAIVSLVVFGQGAWAQDVEWPETIGSMTLNDDNSSNKFYPVSSGDNLNDLAVYVNEGNTCEGLTFKVTKNISFSQSESDEFVPIGYGDGLDGVPFAGTFDGQGNVISGINYSDPEGTSIGLFGYISGALIQNVKMDHCSFTGNFDVGAIAGLASGVHDGSNHGIYNCIVGSHVTVKAVSATIESEEFPGTFAGGIIGDCANTTLSGCVSAATVTGDDCVGGIAGRLISSRKNEKERGVIENCLFMGRVTGTTNKGDIVGARGAVIEGEEGTEGLLQPAELTQLTLLDNDTEAVIDNATWLSYYNGAEGVDVTLAGRTLIKDGYWNTLCLPFDLSQDEVQLQLNPSALKTLLSSAYDSQTSTLTLNFADATTIEAGKPYLIKWTAGGSNRTNPVFTNVIIDNTSEAVTTDYVDFAGSFSPVSLEANDKTVLYLGASNKLYYPSQNRTMSSCRAVFRLHNGLTAGDLPTPAQANARAFVLNFGSDETTGIVEVNADEDLKSASHESGISNPLQRAWYDLQGRRLTGKPTAKGIYINNGIKVVIK